MTLIKRLTLFCILMTFCTVPALAATEQVWVAGAANGDLTSSTTTEFSSLVGGTSWTNDVHDRGVMCSTPGTMTRFRVVLDAAPGSGTSYTFTIAKAAAAGNSSFVGTALAVTISDTDTDAEIVTNVTVSAGEKLVIRSQASNTPTAVHATWCTNFTPDTDDYTVLMGSSGSDTALTSGSYQYLYAPNFDDPQQDGKAVFPVSGTIRDYYVNQRSAPGSGKSITYTVYKNGVATAITATISDTNTTANDTSNTITVAAGDWIIGHHSESGAPTNNNNYWGVVFVPDTSGQFCYFSSGDNVISGSATEYTSLNIGDHAWDATEEDWEGLVNTANTFTLQRIELLLSGSVGSGSDQLVGLVRNTTDASDTSLSATITAGNSTASAASDVEIASGKELVFKYTTTTADLRNLTVGIQAKVDIAPTNTIIYGATLEGATIN